MSKSTKFNKMDRRSFIGKTSIAIAGLAALKTQAFAMAAKSAGLGELYKDDFLIGVAFSANIFRNTEDERLEIIKREFNSITTGNAFKWGPIHPNDDEWRFELPDKFVEFGIENNLHRHGHVLVWHSQVPRNLFVDSSGNQITKEALLKKLENHISTLVGRYKGRINSWDVVNEAIEEKSWRKSPWTEIIGREFMETAFQLAHDADPEAHLIYNDYNMDKKGRRDQVIKMVKDFQKRNVPIHGIGMQGHVGLDYPDLNDFEESMKAFADTGLKIHISELDVTVLPYDWGRTAEISTNREYAASLNPYTDGLPKKVARQLADRYAELFELFLKYRESVDRVTFWGLNDGGSWKNNFPMRGRTDYPLLFDRENKPKLCYDAVAKLKM